MRAARSRTRLVGAVVVLTAACSTTGVGHGTSVSPPPPDVSPSPTSSPVSPTPTGSPGPESPLDAGFATLTLFGDLRRSVGFARVATPAVWAPPPAPMDVTWLGGSGQEFHVSGISFVSRAETSADHVLSFTVAGPDGPVEFASSAGECSITITPALPDNMGGLFTCTLLTDVEGVMTVDARGAFSATG